MKRQLVGKFVSAAPNAAGRHFIGLPPSLTGGHDQRIQMEPAAILVIQETSEGFFLDRYSANGNFAGDTWHGNVEDAQHQAAVEYENCVVQWHDVPEHVEDVTEYALSQLGIEQD